MGTGCGNDLRFGSICAKLKFFRRKFILQNLWRRIRAFQEKKVLIDWTDIGREIGLFSFVIDSASYYVNVFWGKKEKTLE